MGSLDFVKQVFSIKLKILKEYRINFFLEACTTVLYSFTFLGFLLIFNLNFYSILGWEVEQICFFILFEGVGLLFSGMFFYGFSLRRDLISGDFNLFLVRPVSVFLQYFFSKVQVFTGFVGFAFLLVLFVFGLIFQIDLFRFLLVLFLVFFAVVFFVLSMLFLDSLAFFVKRNEFFISFYKKFSGVFENYPLAIFKGEIFYVGLLSANVYYTSIAVLFLFGEISFFEIFFYFLLLGVFVLILSFLVFFVWRFGVRSYEAFG